jgi:diguanylate cyclase (GGDEF)-like protein
VAAEMKKLDLDSFFLPTLAWSSLGLLLISKTLLDADPSASYLTYTSLFGISASLGLSERRSFQRNRLIAKLQEAAMTDQLTGIGNRRMLEGELHRQLAQYQRHNIPFSILAADLDHFKSVNDTWGHDAGDLVLKSFTRVATAVLRDIDILFRIGGEEFLAILPCTELSQAKVAAERLRSAVEKSSTPYGNHEINVTVSLGIASIEKDDCGESMMKRADQALYEAKSNNRNQAVAKTSERSLFEKRDVEFAQLLST